MSSYESERRPIAVYEFAGSLAIESKLVFTLVFSVRVVNAFYQEIPSTRIDFRVVAK